MAKLVYATDSKSVDLKNRVGSSPTIATKEIMEIIVGYDVSNSINDIIALCPKCYESFDGNGDTIYQDDDWGGYECKCNNCNYDIDVNLISPCNV